MIVGEDLGTVPRAVRPAMRAHNIHRSYVLQEEIKPAGPRRPPAASLASVNTHDMPTFAAFWEGRDIGERVEAGWLSSMDATRERTRRRDKRRALVDGLRRDGVVGPRRQPDAPETMTAVVSWLGGSDAAVVAVALEDLWLEAAPQNVPGTTDRPNWRRRAAHRLDEIVAMPEVTERLRVLDARRRGKEGP